MLERVPSSAADIGLKRFVLGTVFNDVVEFLEGGALRNYKDLDMNHDGELDETELIRAVEIFLEMKRNGEPTVPENPYNLADNRGRRCDSLKCS